jgi:hypothetical protein
LQIKSLRKLNLLFSLRLKINESLIKENFYFLPERRKGDYVYFNLQHILK